MFESTLLVVTMELKNLQARPWYQNSKSWRQIMHYFNNNNKQNKAKRNNKKTEVVDHEVMMKSEIFKFW